MRRFALVGLVALFLLPAAAPAQGILQRVRFATNPDKYRPPPFPAYAMPQIGPRSTPSNNWNLAGSGNSGEGLGTLVALTVIGATAPFWGPHVLWDEGFGTPGFFPGRPYAYPDAGYMLIGHQVARHCEDQEAAFFDDDYLKPWSLRVSAEDGHNFGTLNRLGGQLFLDAGWRLGVLTDWNYYSEAVNGGTDQTLFGDVNFTYRVTQSEWLQMHLGAGARMQFDRDGDRAGFNFLYRGDLFPVQPFHLTTAVELGNLQKAFVLHTNVGLGVNWRRWVGYVGYDFLRIGGVNLQGPFAGLRLWF